MEKLIKAIIILVIIIGLPLLADTISNFITMGYDYEMYVFRIRINFNSF